MKLRLIPTLALLISLPVAFAACSDEDSKYTNDYGIGSPCTCEGEGCDIYGVPVPVPAEGKGTIKGCENVDTSNMGGGVLACIRSIPADFEPMAPVTYFPQGYCAIAAVNCTGSTFCGSATYGDVSTMASCPAGSVFLSSVFDYDIMGQASVITENMCVRACKSDSDCNQDGEMTCIERSGHKFCYHEKNFKFLCKDYKNNDCSNISYVDF